MKPFTWPEIQEILKKELAKTKHIMTFGTIGSCNIERDIDLIITKKPESKIKDFYKELHGLFFRIENYLNKKFNASSYRFYRSEEQAILEYLFPKKKKVFFHTHIYLNYNQIKMDWGWAVKKELRSVLEKNCTYLMGSSKEILTGKFNTSSITDNVALYLFQYDKINSGYPKELFLKLMSNNLDFVLRKKLKIVKDRIVVKNKKQALDLFYKACEELDK